MISLAYIIVLIICLNCLCSVSNGFFFQLPAEKRLHLFKVEKHTFSSGNSMRSLPSYLNNPLLRRGLQLSVSLRNLFIHDEGVSPFEKFFFSKLAKVILKVPQEDINKSRFVTGIRNSTRPKGNPHALVKSYNASVRLPHRVTIIARLISTLSQPLHRSQRAKMGLL